MEIRVSDVRNLESVYIYICVKNKCTLGHASVTSSIFNEFRNYGLSIVVGAQLIVVIRRQTLGLCSAHIFNP